MPDYTDFDRRGYRTVDDADGLQRVVPTYEDRSGCDGRGAAGRADRARVERRSAGWPIWVAAPAAAYVVAEARPWPIDGVDLTPEMLDVARGRGLHERLVEADVADTGLEAGAYDLVIASLVDEGTSLRSSRSTQRHGGSRARAARTWWSSPSPPSSWPPACDALHGRVRRAGRDRDTHAPDLRSRALRARAGFGLAEMHEGVVVERWLELKPKWGRFRGHPVSMAFAWRAWPSGAPPS